MKTLFKIAILAFAAVWMAACGAPATNTNTNTNTNTAKPAAAAPTKEALLALDKQANEAYGKSDSKFFETFLSDKFVMSDGGKRMDKAAVVKMIAGIKCEVKSIDLTEPQMAMIDADTAVLVYKSAFEGTCDGQKVPSPMRAASAFVRSGDKWLGVWHGETLIVDPKAPPAAPAKKDEAKKEEPKKDDAKAPEAKTDAKPAEAKPDAALTDTLVAVEKSGWEAWKARDKEKLTSLVTKEVGFVDAIGTVSMGLDAALKAWTEPKCDIKSVNVADGAASSFSDKVAILTFKGTADGTCDGQKLGALYGTSIFVKDGATWRLGFGFETPVM